MVDSSGDGPGSSRLDHRSGVESDLDGAPCLSDVRIWYAAVTRSSMGKLLLARMTIPNCFSGTNATYAPKPLVDPVLLIQTSSRGFCGGVISVTGVALKIIAGEFPSSSVFNATGYGYCSHIRSWVITPALK